MAERIAKDKMHAKIAELIAAYGDANDDQPGRFDGSLGTPFHDDLTEWVDEQKLKPNASKIATQAIKDYTEAHKHLRNVDLGIEAQIRIPFAEYEEGALMALSLDRAEYIQVGHAKRIHLSENNFVITENVARVSRAGAIKVQINNRWYRELADADETVAQGVKRVREQSAQAEDQRQAAD